MKYFSINLNFVYVLQVTYKNTYTYLTFIQIDSMNLEKIVLDLNAKILYTILHQFIILFCTLYLNVR